MRRESGYPLKAKDVTTSLRLLPILLSYEQRPKAAAFPSPAAPEKHAGPPVSSRFCPQDPAEKAGCT